MNNQINDLERAFPNYEVTEKGVCFPMGGMTLRDYFAAKVMQGLISLYSESLLVSHNQRSIFHKQISLTSYEVADEMLEARKTK